MLKSDIKSCPSARDGHFRIVYYSRIVKPNPEYQILFCFFPTMHCTWELLKNVVHSKTKEAHTVHFS